MSSRCIKGRKEENREVLSPSLPSAIAGVKLPFPMALMHDYVRRANFTTKPRLRGIFSAFALFVRGYSFKFTALGHSFMQNFATLQFKTRLGGEICSLDVNMHKGYSFARINKWRLGPSLGGYRSVAQSVALRSCACHRLLLFTYRLFSFLEILERSRKNKNHGGF